jgi:hypothetical protein
MRPETSARCLRWVLRCAGAVLLMAFAAIFLPAEWMSATHAWLGLGTFPRSPLVEYLTRSLSALYAIKGGLYLVLSTDVVRYTAVISYVGWSTIAFGAGMVIVDTHAGMPWYWTLLEGPPIAGMGLALVWLRRRLGPR